MSATLKRCSAGQGRRSMNSGSVYLFTFGLTFVSAFLVVMAAPVWFGLATLVLSVVALFWWIRRW